jgi:hypothetical protein
MNRIVPEQVGEHVVTGQVVDVDEFDAGVIPGSSKYVSSNASKTI